MNPYERNRPNERVPWGQLTQRFAPFTSEPQSAVRQTIADVPVRQAPFRRTATIEPSGAVPILEQDAATIAPNTSNPNKPEALQTVCFEPLRVHTAARSPLATTIKTAQAFPFPRTPKSKATSSKPMLFARLGQLSKQTAFIAWVGGAALALSGAANFGLAHRWHAEGKPTLLHPTSIASATAHAPASPLALGKASVNSANKQPPVQALELSAAAPVAAPPTPVNRGQIFDPALNAAVGHLLAGRYGDAQKLYEELKSRNPTDPALAVVSKLLTARLKQLCAGSTRNPAVSCPEVKR